MFKELLTSGDRSLILEVVCLASLGRESFALGLGWPTKPCNPVI